MCRQYIGHCLCCSKFLNCFSTFDFCVNYKTCSVVKNEHIYHLIKCDYCKLNCNQKHHGYKDNCLSSTYPTTFSRKTEKQKQIQPTIDESDYEEDIDYDLSDHENECNIDEIPSMSDNISSMKI